MAINKKIDLNPFEPMSTQIQDEEARDLSVNTAAPIGAEQPIEDPGAIFEQEQLDVSTPEAPRQGELSESLKMDLARAESGFAEAQKERGISAPSQVSSLRQKGVRIAGKAVAVNEYNRSIEVQNKAIDSLLTKAGFSSQMEMNEARHHINNRLNTLRMDLLKRGLEFDKRLATAGADRAKRKAAAGMWGSLAGTMAGGVLGSLAGPGGAAAGAQAGAGIGGAVGRSQG